MDLRDFSRKEIEGILDAIDLSVRSRTLAEVTGACRKVMGLAGADNAVFALAETGPGGDPSTVRIVNLDHPVEWLRDYEAQRLYEKDPVLRAVLETSSPCLWKEMREKYRHGPCKDFMRKAAGYGLIHGLSGGMSGASGKTSFFSLSGGSDRFGAREKEALGIISPHIHQALLRLFAGRMKKNAGISGREKEVLRWMLAGKTNWEISMILNISERTVKFHVKNIEWKLNAANKAHAIAIAMESGIEDL